MCTGGAAQNWCLFFFAYSIDFSSVKVWWLTPVTLGLGNRRKRLTASLSSACFTWWVSGQPGRQSEFPSCFKTEQTELSDRIIRAACFPFGEGGEYLILITTALSTISQKDCDQVTGFVLQYLSDPATFFPGEAGRLVGGVQGHRPFISRPGRS